MSKCIKTVILLCLLTMSCYSYNLEVLDIDANMEFDTHELFQSCMRSDDFHIVKLHEKIYGQVLYFLFDSRVPNQAYILANRMGGERIFILAIKDFNELLDQARAISQQDLIFDNEADMGAYQHLKNTVTLLLNP